MNTFIRKCLVKVHGKRLFLWLALVITANDVFAKNIEVCLADFEIFPFVMGRQADFDSTSPGVAVDMLRSVDALHPDINLTFYRAPWKRCLQRVASGDSQAIVSNFVTIYEDLMLFPKDDGELDRRLLMAETRQCLFKRTASNLVWQQHAFSGQVAKPVSIPRGFTIAKQLALNGIPFVEVDSTKLAFQQLFRGQLEGVITFCENGQEQLLQYDDDSMYQSTEIKVDQAFLAFNHRYAATYPDIAQSLWESVAAVRHSSFASMFKHYMDKRYLAKQSNPLDSESL